MTALAVCGAFLLISGSGLAWKMWDNSKQVISNNMGYEPVMWKNEAADSVFPDSLAVRPGSQEARTDSRRAAWKRLGIGRKESCEKALSPELAEKAKATGCEGVVRATYTDPTGNMMATVALIIRGRDGSPDLDDYFQQDEESEAPDPYVHALAEPETVAAGWNDEARMGASGGSFGLGSYALAVTTGPADGRKSGGWEVVSEVDTEQRGPWKAAADNFLETYKNYLDELTHGEDSA